MAAFAASASNSPELTSKSTNHFIPLFSVKSHTLPPTTSVAVGSVAQRIAVVAKARLCVATVGIVEKPAGAAIVVVLPHLSRTLAAV